MQLFYRSVAAAQDVGDRGIVSQIRLCSCFVFVKLAECTWLSPFVGRVFTLFGHGSILLHKVVIGTTEGFILGLFYAFCTISTEKIFML